MPRFCRETIKQEGKNVLAGASFIILQTLILNKTHSRALAISMVPGRAHYSWHKEQRVLTIVQTSIRATLPS